MPGVSNGVARDQDEVVITGLSGRLPQSDNIEEFAKQLFDGVDLVTANDTRWPRGAHGLPERNGRIKNLSRFDATFFGVHAKQAHLMDPQLRMLLELTHEAIVDAGMNPVEMRGSKTGVFVGVSNSESEELWTADPDKINGYALTGCCRAMFPNRISYTFNFQGPSYAIDTACSSSSFALTQALAAMRAGHCDAAVVAGTNICLKPTSSLNFNRLSMLSVDGACKAFDASGNGYVRSEAAVVVLLQRKSAARRVYARLLNARCNTDGFKEQGITFPAGRMQQALIEETYREIRLDPALVDYVEAHGTGTKVGDPQEVNSIAEVFCKGRQSPVLLGSVKSNMGHSEPASGLCSVAKIVVALEECVIPGNLHFKSPNPDIPALNDGRIKVVDKNTPWKGGIVAMNSFGFGGANAHVVLASDPTVQNETPWEKLEYPRLVVASGRTEPAVLRLLEVAEQYPQDAALHALLHSVHSAHIPGHTHRGFAVLDAGQAAEVGEMEGAERRPVWFVFSGMGSQWAGMAKELVRLPAVARSLRRSAEALAPHGLDLWRIVTTATDEDFRDVIHSFVSIAAMQVAMVDVLRELGIRPDGIVGHSVGEIGCAYADETLTAEQAVLAAYWRGRSIKDARLGPGAMAAVGLSWEVAKERCPPRVYAVCHNSADSVTISGPVEDIEKFVEKLQAEQIFARRVESADVAFHSEYVKPAAPLLAASLAKVIPKPKPRSSRWISTSVPRERWGEPLCALSSVEYHVNNLLSPVLFAEALEEIPERALVLELAPHALLQAVLRRALQPRGAKVLPLVRKDQPQPLRQILSNIGRMYVAGAQPKISSLYPEVKFPVPRGTPRLASAVLWDHSNEWDVADFSKANLTGENIIEYDLSKNDDAFISGHTIDGRVLFPATGYLTLVWRTLAKLLNKKPEQTRVVLEDVHFLRATIMPRDGPVRFLVSILSGSGNFELSEGGAIVVTGKIREIEEDREERLSLTPYKDDRDLPPLVSEDIYKELRLRGYDYADRFRGILSADPSCKNGTLTWEGNWITFMDTMLQFSICGEDARGLYLPTRMLRAVIDPRAQAPSGPLSVHDYKDIGVIQAGGVEFRGVKVSLAPRRTQTQAAPKLERYEFVADDGPCEMEHALLVAAQLVLENTTSLRLKAAEETQGRPAETLLAPRVAALLEAEPAVRVDTCARGTADAYPGLAEAGIALVDALPPDNHLVMAANVLRTPGDALATLFDRTSADGMVLLHEAGNVLDDASVTGTLTKLAADVVCRQRTPEGDVLLLRRRRVLPKESYTIKVTDNDYSWVPKLKEAMKKSETSDVRVYVVGADNSGALGLVKCLRAEAGGAGVRLFMLPAGAPDFTPKHPKYERRANVDLAVNIMRPGDVWGTYRHLPLTGHGATLRVRHAYVNTLARGDLSSLRWIEAPLEQPGDLEPCSVYYAPLNFRDVMLATGKLPPDALPGALAGQDCVLGLEFSGRDSRGARVMGMVPARGLATSVCCDRTFLWPVPERWSLADAATVPVVYSTAYYALVVRGGMRGGERLLVHAGSGGVGQAAIAIALAAGCRVFSTVGTEEKREFLLKRFPGLRSEDVGNSRDCSFEQMVMRATGGCGVQLVLNSLAEDKLQASVRCLAVGGRFLEIGKLDLSNNTALGMSIFLKNTSFHGILLDALFESDGDERERQLVVKCMNEGLASGAVQPLPATVYGDTQLEAAFRYMATGKHIGKVLLKVRDEEAAGAAPSDKTVPAIPRTYLRPDKVFVLAGGLGGFGLELAGWLISRGARNLVLVSRGGVRTGYQAWRIRRWVAAGNRVAISTADITTTDGARKLLREATTMGPVAGIFNLAAVLRDAFLENQTEDDFRTVARPKIDGTRVLDIVSRELAPQLEYFVVFSSVSCGRGNPGQSNYGLANSWMERLCEERQKAGLPALAVQWGAVGDVGLVADTLAGAEVGGTLPQRISSCLDTLGELLGRPHAVAGSLVLADKRRGPQAPRQDLVQAVANILGIQHPDRVPDAADLAELGMDSLMGAEIKQTLERGYDLALGVQEVRALTFGKLRQMAGGDASPAAAPTPVTPAAPEPKDLAQLAALDELMPKEVLVKMPSQPSSQGGDRQVFMLHPVEGSVSVLEGLAERVKGRVWGLQSASEVPLRDMAALAAHYVRRVLETADSGPLLLVGYSFGAGVAFEMALQLEAAGRSARLVLVDGSPDYLAQHTHRGKKRSTRTAATDEADALAYFAQQFVDVDAGRLSLQLEALADWEARVEHTLQLVGGRHPRGDLAEAARSFYHKLVIMDTYRPSGRVRGPVTLFTARDNYVALEHDYGLGARCTCPVEVEQLSGNHRSILSGDSAQRIADYISKLLSL